MFCMLIRLLGYSSFFDPPATLASFNFRGNEDADVWLTTKCMARVFRSIDQLVICHKFQFTYMWGHLEKKRKCCKRQKATAIGGFFPFDASVVWSTDVISVSSRCLRFRVRVFECMRHYNEFYCVYAWLHCHRIIRQTVVLNIVSLQRCENIVYRWMTGCKCCRISIVKLLPCILR